MNPEKDFETHRTPNPDSLKVTTHGRRFIESGMESYRSPAEAAPHPLGASLFEIPGVADVFLMPTFLTVTKSPSADWDDLWPGVEERLRAFLSSPTPGDASE